MQSMKEESYKKKIKQNLKLFYWLEAFRSLIFYVPVWVAFERRFISLSQLTFVESMIFAAQLVLELPTGAFADLVGRRISMTLGHFFKAMGMVVFAFAGSFKHFLIYGALIGTGDALISGSKEAILYDSLKEVNNEDEFAKYSSRYSLVFQVGLSAATVVGGFLSSWWFRLPPLGYGLACLAAAMVSFSFIEPKIDSEKFSLKSYVKQTKQGFKELFKNQHIKLISWFYIAVGLISWPAMLTFKTILMTELEYTDFELGWTQATIRVLNSLVLFRFLSVEKLFNRKRVYLFFPILMIVSFLPGIWLTKWLALPFVAGAMLSSTARWVILAKYTNAEFSSKNRATAISTLSMIIGLFSIVLIGLSGPVAEALGGIKYIYSFLGVLSLLVVLPLGIRLASKESQGIRES